MNQHQLILRALKVWTSPLEALHKAGTMKLATRITELRRAGHVIDDKWVEQGGKRFKSYRLVK